MNYIDEINRLKKLYKDFQKDKTMANDITTYSHEGMELPFEDSPASLPSYSIQLN